MTMLFLISWRLSVQKEREDLLRSFANNAKLVRRQGGAAAEAPAGCCFAAMAKHHHRCPLGRL